MDQSQSTNYGEFMEIQIETTYLPLIVGREDLPAGVQLIRKPWGEGDRASSVIGTLSFPSRVTAGSIALWIYDKMKHIKDKQRFILKINHKEVCQFDLASITQTIEREIETSKNEHGKG